MCVCVCLQASVEFYYSQRGRLHSGRRSCRLSGWASFTHFFAQRWKANSSTYTKYLEGEPFLSPDAGVCLCVQEPRLRLRPGALGCFTQVMESISPSPPSVSGFKVQTHLSTSAKHTPMTHFSGTGWFMAVWCWSSWRPAKRYQIVHSNCKMFSSFTHPHVIFFLHKRRSY